MTQASVTVRPSIPRPAALSRWLWAVALLVIMVVAVGGITRLTESGLSITEWKPVSGVLPPLTEAGWQAEFEKYKQIPEYREINAGMSLAAFKGIFFWEWLHRILGRLVGIALLVPLAFFAWRRAIPAGFGARLLGLAALVGLQGAIGWWMVASGLVDRTDVSHFRLALHLLTALFLLAALVWTARDFAVMARDPVAVRPRLTGVAWAVIAILFVQLLLGAWVAGLNAGYVASTWPSMNDHFVPEGIDWSRGAWFAFTNDPFLLHFLHRWWSWAAAIALLLLARTLGRRGARTEAMLLILVVAAQMTLGILTVVTGVSMWIAVLHQVTGAILVATTAASLHRLGRPAA
ncbi:MULTISPECIES: COX15/CtaA family protein [unclassified Sphingopyxis]|uniref:COX15/CtaA family protein n=1 Tax=unclassified Sphingopyxis TaxID=2614943 RepID=UPI0007316BED|nr:MULTISPECIES: COX15/CtaA family protein [unclassified Sphingopyxis]KTE28245.1 heme A synthase [Sphingopyxis sp. H057]KTE55373.1 heme A synthase [Sphingopyxis sp. H073]KTE57736.1 heme A synthase [Sphingopyxis sp. H071]KTE59789.1 heme A synthase [Sphingopyxis sp. H100]KTE61027.1 heme A synthase [Sphingopyxis sp. H107]